jgi:hypothetical protein
LLPGRKENSQLTNLIVVDTITKSMASMAANTTVTKTESVSKTGYTPLMACISDNSDGYVAVQGCKISGNNVTVKIRNLNAVSINLNYDITVIYKKS